MKCTHKQWGKSKSGLHLTNTHHTLVASLRGVHVKCASAHDTISTSLTASTERVKRVYSLPLIQGIISPSLHPMRVKRVTIHTVRLSPTIVTTHMSRMSVCHVIWADLWPRMGRDSRPSTRGRGERQIRWETFEWISNPSMFLKSSYVRWDHLLIVIIVERHKRMFLRAGQRR